MIFISKNEDGIPAWKLILEGKKTVTRRIKPIPVGKEFAVQPGRGKKAVCRARVISCMNTKEWLDWMRINTIADTFKATLSEDSVLWSIKSSANKEAKREGFKSWTGLCDWFRSKKIDMYKTYRIEFKVIE